MFRQRDRDSGPRLEGWLVRTRNRCRCTRDQPVLAHPDASMFHLMGGKATFGYFIGREGMGWDEMGFVRPLDSRCRSCLLLPPGIVARSGEPPSLMRGWRTSVCHYRTRSQTMVFVEYDDDEQRVTGNWVLLGEASQILWESSRCCLTRPLSPAEGNRPHLSYDAG